MPLTWRAMSSESLTTSTSVAPSARARSSPRSRPRYSATLFVVVPRVTAASSTTSPAGVDTTAAAAAGPGLPRAPPSTWTTTFTPAKTIRALSQARARLRALVGGDRRELARHAGTAAIAQLAMPPTRRARLAPLRLAPVDDHRDVGIAVVVRGKPVVQLVGERLGNDAVDHGRDSTRCPRRRYSTIR